MSVLDAVGTRQLVLGLLLAFFFQPAPAQPAEGETRWGLGAGVAAIQKPYDGVDDDVFALPILIVENRWVSIAGPVFDLKLPSPETFSLRLRARFDPGLGYEADDSLALAGMDERKAGLWLGAAVTWRTALVDINAEWLGDGSGYSEGQRATFGVQRRFALGEFHVTPRVEAIWLDDDNVDYYYGVRAEEAIAGRAIHAGESTINSRIGVRVDYRVRTAHSLFLDLSATQLGDEIADSPIVDGSSSSVAFVGYAYLF